MASFKTALVTGGAGFIGGHLVSLLVKDGVHVTILDPAVNTKGLPKSITAIKGSILDNKALDQAVKGQACVFHLAALTHLWAREKSQFEAVNVEGTRNVLAAVKKHKISMTVVTSTEAILRGYRDPNPFPITENDAAPDVSDMAGPYTRSKYTADRLVQKAASNGLPVVSVYPTVPIGAGDFGMTAPTKMVLDFVRGRTLAYLNALLNYVAVEDVAKGHYLAAERGSPGERFILGGENLAMQHLLELLAADTKKKMPRRRVPYFLAYATAIVLEFFADILTRKAPVASKEGVRLAMNSSFVSTHLAEQRLGYYPTPVNSAIRRTIQWFEEQKLI